jgi:UDP-N-acetylglucosamine--N-acetylmuramyl-(pentapeptide) pyrophosphoryl-undecaprenol N-acetylglucosamine transferase
MSPLLGQPTAVARNDLGARSLAGEPARARLGAMPSAQSSFPEPSAMRGLRVAFAGGGTCGHIVPGRHMLAHAGGQLGDVVWFATGRPVEERAFAGLDSALAGVACERVTLELEPDGGGAPSLIGLARRSPGAIRAARAALKAHGSQVLLGLGGYTCLPAVVAAYSLGIPVALLEINSERGRATRTLAPLAKRICHAWRATLPNAGETARDVWTGPPLAPAYARGTQANDTACDARSELGFDGARPLMVVLGGSQGASALNRFVHDHIDALVSQGVAVLHQTGPNRLDQAAQPRAGYRAVEYLDDVHRALSAATFVLCRGGASTLAEVGALRRPALVVPYPHHADKHQERNALQFGHGVRIVDESRLGPDFARELVQLGLPGGASELGRMARELEGKVRLDAATRVWTELLNLRDPSATTCAPPTRA